MDKKELWLRLKNYSFDHVVQVQLMDEIREKFGGEKASKRAFRDKLVRRFYWSEDFAKKAVNEYLKFIYLALTTNYAVTPSKVIDQVWCEHILFTQGYKKFCEEVIERPFDRHPELLSGNMQSGIFNAQHQNVLVLYKNEFNVEAPEDVWGKQTFDTARLRNEILPLKKRDRRGGDSVTASSYGDTPLFTHFNDVETGGVHTEMYEFNGYGGGKTGGAGAQGTYETPTHHHVEHQNIEVTHTDSLQVEVAPQAEVGCDFADCSCGSSE